MKQIAPKVEDHCKIQILVTTIGAITEKAKLLGKLVNEETIPITTSPNRCVLAKFVQETNLFLKFSDLQTFRKIFGVICIGTFDSFVCDDADIQQTCSHLEQDSNGKSNTEGDGTLTADPSATLPYKTHQALSSLKKAYCDVKSEFSDYLVDARCVVFGAEEIPATADSPEFIFNGTKLESDVTIAMAAEELERIAHELVQGIYYVIESKRLDTSAERAENLTCLSLPEEEKYQVGVENLKPKQYRKKCRGRLRKRIGDYALLAGLPEAALAAYQSSIDLLKSVSDFLWLAAAYEGWCCAAMVIKHRNHASQLQSENKTCTTPPTELCRVPTISDPLYTLSEHEVKTSGHQRYRSDEGGVHLFNLSYRQLSDEKESETDDESDSRVDAESCSSFEKTASSNNSPSLSRKTSSKSVNQENAADSSLNGAEERPKQRMFGGGTGTTSRKKPWRQFLNFDMLTSKKQKQLKNSMNVMPPPSLAHTTPANKSSSMQNLAATSTSASTQFLNGAVKHKQHHLSSISRGDIIERFKLAVENYKKFSFVVHIEYQCVMRSVSIYIFHQNHIEIEAFLRDHNGRYLDDKFETFDNIMKAEVCMANAAIFHKIGFARKTAFFQRLAVLFRLHVDNADIRHSESDYREVYPVIHRTLDGYGIGNNRRSRLRPGSFREISPAKVPFALQIKAINEVCICATRAGYCDIAVRHLTYIIQNYFDSVDKAVILQMVEELNKLVKNCKNVHHLNEPIVLEDATYPPNNVVLKPLQLTRIPTVSHFEICSLPAYLTTTLVRTTSPDSKIFIYSPFQNREKNKKETYWVVNCPCEVSLQMHNPLPIELEVKNFTLLTEGCSFDPFPIKINLPSCFGAVVDPNPKKFKISGIPRSIGRLTFTGYTCEVFGVRNECTLVKHQHQQHKHGHHYQSVEVLSEQPLLEVEVSLPRTPLLNEPRNNSIAEAMVFSGQSIDQPLTLYNSSDSIAIRRVSITINQPAICAGPKLLKLVPAGDDCENTAKYPTEVFLYDLNPGERREIKFRIFGIDPATSTPSSAGENQQSQIGEEHKVFLKRSTSSSQLTVVSASSIAGTSSVSPPPRSPKINQRLSVPASHKRGSSFPSLNSTLLPATNSDSVRLLDDTDNSSGFDLIPYTGRVLSTDISFFYVADLPSVNGEEYCRCTKLPLAITVLPAVSVSEWQIKKGNGPTTRYVFVDVNNHTNSDVELTYGDGKMMSVQSKEICRVPLLCPCCPDIQTRDFQNATQKASHMLQMQEIEQLRRRIEEHVAKHLIIHWTIPKMKLNGVVPMGSLLSSVSFLKQLVVPELSLIIHANGSLCENDEAITVGIGEVVSLSVHFLCSTKDKESTISGSIELACYQEIQVNQVLEGSENFIMCGPNRRPFEISTLYDATHSTNNEALGSCQPEIKFNLFFLCEGLHKIEPKISDLFLTNKLEQCSTDDVFIPAVSFNVITRL